MSGYVSGYMASFAFFQRTAGSGAAVVRNMLCRVGFGSVHLQFGRSTGSPRAPAVGICGVTGFLGGTLAALGLQLSVIHCALWTKST